MPVYGSSLCLEWCPTTGASLLPIISPVISGNHLFRGFFLTASVLCHPDHPDGEEKASHSFHCYICYKNGGGQQKEDFFKINHCVWSIWALHTCEHAWCAAACVCECWSVHYGASACVLTFQTLYASSGKGIASVVGYVMFYVPFFLHSFFTVMWCLVNLVAQIHWPVFSTKIVKHYVTISIPIGQFNTHW